MIIHQPRHLHKYYVLRKQRVFSVLYTLWNTIYQLQLCVDKKCITRMLSLYYLWMSRKKHIKTIIIGQSRVKLFQRSGSIRLIEVLKIFLDTQMIKSD